MIIAFVDTLFFVLFSPSEEDCQILLEEDCLSASSAVTSDGHLCKWNADDTVENGGSCAINVLPESMIFFVVVAFIVTVVAVPFKILSFLLLEEICALSPDFEGSAPTFFSNSSYRMSALGKILNEIKGNNDDIVEEDEDVGGVTRDPIFVDKETRPLAASSLESLSYLSRVASYYDVSPPSEEVEYLLRTARGYLARFLANMPVPWEDYSVEHLRTPLARSRASSRALTNIPPSPLSPSSPGRSPQKVPFSFQDSDYSVNDGGKTSQAVTDESLAFTKTQLRINEMLRVLNLNDDGSAAPLGWMQFLRHGTHARYLQSKLRSARSKADSIEDEFSRVNDGEEDLKDVMLIQHFILEALSPLQRFVVRKKFFDFEMQEPERIGKYTWIAGWTLEWITMIFLCYYVLAWAALVGDMMFRSWLIQFSFILVEDFFITQMIRAILVHGLAISYCKPQLLQIYHLLKRITVRKILKQDDYHDDIRVVQHMSASCRAARRESLRELPAAQLLMQIDDNDMKLCNDVRRLKFTWWQVLLISIPLFFGIAGDQGQEFFFDMVINIAWGGILIINAILLTVMSFWYLVGFYFLIFIFIIYRAIRFYKKRKIKAKAKRKTRGELARFMSMRQKKTKFNLVSHIKVRNVGNQLELSKHDLQWRNMNLCLRQPVTTSSRIDTATLTRTTSQQLSGHSETIPNSIRKLSTLAPLLAQHYPAPVEDDAPRPISWHRHTSIRSRHRSPRVATFWANRKKSARESQMNSAHYTVCRDHFLRISDGKDRLSDPGDVLALATWVSHIKTAPDNKMDSYSEVEDINNALSSLMLYYDNYLSLNVFLDWLIDEELLLDPTFGSALSNKVILSKVDIHNEIEYSEEKDKLSRWGVMRRRGQVKNHRKRGEIDIFAQIVKEITAAQVAQRALMNSSSEQQKTQRVQEQQQQRQRQQQQHAGHGDFIHPVTSEAAQQLATRDHQLHQAKLKHNKPSSSGPHGPSIARGSARRASMATPQNKSKPGKLRRSSAGFYKPSTKSSTPLSPSRRTSVASLTSPTPGGSATAPGTVPREALAMDKHLLRRSKPKAPPPVKVGIRRGSITTNMI